MRSHRGALSTAAHACSRAAHVRGGLRAHARRRCRRSICPGLTEIHCLGEIAWGKRHRKQSSARVTIAPPNTSRLTRHLRQTHKADSYPFPWPTDAQGHLDHSGQHGDRKLRLITTSAASCAVGAVQDGGQGPGRRRGRGRRARGQDAAGGVLGALVRLLHLAVHDLQEGRHYVRRHVRLRLLRPHARRAVTHVAHHPGPVRSHPPPLLAHHPSADSPSREATPRRSWQLTRLHGTAHVALANRSGSLRGMASTEPQHRSQLCRQVGREAAAVNSEQPRGR